MAKVTKFKCDQCGHENGGADWWGVLLVSDFTKAIIGQLSKFDDKDDKVEHFCGIGCMSTRLLELLEKWSGRYANKNSNQQAKLLTPELPKFEPGAVLDVVAAPVPAATANVGQVAICQECGQPSDGCPCFVGAVQSLGEPNDRRGKVVNKYCACIDDWTDGTSHCQQCGLPVRLSAKPVMPWCKCSPGSLDNVCSVCGGKGMPF